MSADFMLWRNARLAMLADELPWGLTGHGPILTCGTQLEWTGGAMSEVPPFAIDPHRATGLLPVLRGLIQTIIEWKPA